VTRFRPFRNTDPPALARLWNEAVPRTAAARRLTVHELDAHALGGVLFEAAGLIVAERDGRIAGFVHAGFGPELPIPSTRPFELCREIGTVAMLAIEPGLEDTDLAPGLVTAAERYLRSHGAKVIYAGGLFPLNPFYWGVYGGSEGSGVLSGHDAFQRALSGLGYEPVGATVLLEADLQTADPRDPRAALIRRQVQVEFDEDPLPAHWWEELALGEFHLTQVRIRNKSDGARLAGATTWDMQWFGREDGRSRLGLIDLAVESEHRRKGLGRFLALEIFRHARAEAIGLVQVQTAATNEPALAFYASLGFSPVAQSTLFRLPAGAARGS
jgi:ribosomal protein S18 acetylase RimI-like enzyme